LNERVYLVNQKEVNEKNTVQERNNPQEPSAGGLNRIKKVIAVMSGKGGVGKSTVTGLLAVSLKRQGYSVGIMDADITGPSIPRMFGVNKKPENIGLGLLPAESSTGIRIMSLNLLLENEDDPVIWRGPLIGNAIHTAQTVYQFLKTSNIL
jgi:Mrp family chromosome partitioning ATPase